MADDLLQEHSQVLAKGSPALEQAAIDALAQLIPLWKVQPDLKSIEREFKFTDYYETMAFVNALAWIAHTEDHHPDIFVTFNHCKVTYSTHTVKGLSRNDFICAAKLDALIK
jgi:4a-hydroxytetrahydrobiopterin dehydratase